MIKKTVFLFLLFTSLVRTQSKLDQIWDLIAQNKREEAFNLVQKELQKNKEDYPLNLTKLIIEQEQGKVKFTKNDLTVLLKDELEHYVYPLNLCAFASVSKNDGYNDSYFEEGRMSAPANNYQKRCNRCGKVMAVLHSQETWLDVK